MTGEDLCSKCGKKIRAGRSGSLTQWLFSDDSCECEGKMVSLKLADQEPSGFDTSRMCEFCGKLRSDSRQGSLTQWVFGAERCSCDYEKLKPLAKDILGESEEVSSSPFQSDIDPDLIDILELGEINYHGLSPSAFPFDRYRIISEKGRGNSGIVYEVWDCMLRKRVAIKTLYSQNWSPEELMRFQTEARSSSRLNHPNVLQVYDFGASDSGQPYMVMEFVDGITLKEAIVRDGALKLTDAFPIFLGLCEGTRHAHQQGIFHRDLKSSNIMIGKDRNGNLIVKVIDFGIAALAQNQTQTDPLDSQSLTIVGSPLYMSPDQFNGFKFDVRSEIYSIGCVMFETLTGNVPFEGETVMETISMHARSDIPALVKPDGEPLPEAIDGVVVKALAKSPEARFQSTEEVRDALVEARERIGAFREETKLSPDEEAARRKAKQDKLLKSAGTVVLAGVVLAVIGVAVYKVISLLPAPGAVPSTSEVEIFDKVQPPKNAAKDSLETLSTERIAVQYVASQQRLSIDGTGDGDDLIRRIMALKPKLRELEIYNINLTSESFRKLSELGNIHSLSITDVSGPTPDDWRYLLSHINVRMLRLTDVDANEDFLRIVSGMKGLRHLELDSCTISAPGLALLVPLNLEHLSAKTSHLTSAHIDEIARMKNLEALFLGDTGITDSDIKKLAVLNKLRGLGLNGTGITDSTLTALKDGIPRLGAIYIFRCPNLTQKAVRRFAIERPTCALVNDESDIKNSFAPVD